MLLQRLATGATGVKQARYTQLPMYNIQNTVYSAGTIYEVHVRSCVVYVLVITPLPVIWRVYMHDARGRAAHEGGVHIYQPDHEEGVL